MRPPASPVTPETPILCPPCEKEHPASHYNRDTRRFSGLAQVCREEQRRRRQDPTEKKMTRERDKHRWEDPKYRARSLAVVPSYGKLRQCDLKRAKLRLSVIVNEWKRQ